MVNSKQFSLLDVKLIYFLILTVSMYFFSIDLYAPALPSIKVFFQAPFNQVQWTITLFATGFWSSQLIFGALISHFDKRKILLTTSATFSCLSLAAISAPHIEALYLYRFAQGVCCAAMYVIGFATVRELAEEHRLKTIMPLSSMGFTFMSAISPIIGGFIIYNGEWHQVFICMSLAGLLLFSSTYLLFPRSKTKKRALDIKTISARFIINEAFTNYKSMIANATFMISSFISISAVVAMVVFYQIASFIFIGEAGITSLDFGFICFLLIMVSVLARVYYLKYLRHSLALNGLFKWSWIAMGSALMAFMSTLFQGMAFIVFFAICYSIFMFSLSIVHCYALVFAFTEADRSQAGYSAAIYGTLTASYILVGAVISSVFEPGIIYLIILMLLMAFVCLFGTAYIQYKKKHLSRHLV